MSSLIFYFIAIALLIVVIKQLIFHIQRLTRRDYYRSTYLNSREWHRKRYLVLKRDNWRCVYCGRYATQVHHKRYAKQNIGKEPIEWLVSVCFACHSELHK